MFAFVWFIQGWPFKNAVGYWFLDDKPWLELSTIEEALQTIQTMVELGSVRKIPL